MSRLVSFVDVDVDVGERGTVEDTRRMSVSVRHEAVLDDGRRVLLLDDRGWSSSGAPGVWAMTPVETVVETARTVVGPDEPFGEQSREDAEADHWAHLAAVLRREGIAADARALRELPHDVVLSRRLLARLGHDPGGDVRP